MGRGPFLRTSGSSFERMLAESPGRLTEAPFKAPGEVKKGSIVFFNGYTLHRSLPHRAATGFRRALVNHTT